MCVELLRAQAKQVLLPQTFTVGPVVNFPA